MGNITTQEHHELENALWALLECVTRSKVQKTNLLNLKRDYRNEISNYSRRMHDRIWKDQDFDLESDW